MNPILILNLTITQVKEINGKTARKKRSAKKI